MLYTSEKALQGTTTENDESNGRAAETVLAIDQPGDDEAYRIRVFLLVAMTLLLSST